MYGKSVVTFIGGQQSSEGNIRKLHQYCSEITFISLVKGIYDGLIFTIHQGFMIQGDRKEPVWGTAWIWGNSRNCTEWCQKWLPPAGDSTHGTFLDAPFTEASSLSATRRSHLDVYAAFRQKDIEVGRCHLQRPPGITVIVRWRDQVMKTLCGYLRGRYRNPETM